ncbi:MAG TPA: hypothetical protein VJH04_00805 [archaeon]|nr:hypothetical protein [archaeon]
MLPRRLSTAIIWITAVAGLSYSEYVGHRVRNNRPLVEYVAANKHGLMAQQEKELGIKFNGEPNIQYFSKRDIPGTYYDGETNTLWIDVNDTVSPRNTPECIITRLLKPKADGADETIYHEMGHFYLRQLRMKNGIAQPRTDSEKFHAQRVEEGVAEYFERRMTKFDGFEPFRSGQWHMVKPIIDQYGERGMAFLISNLSKMDEPSEEYQKRVLAALR